MKYEAIKLTGTPENIKAITDKIDKTEQAVKLWVAKWKGRYVIFHPEASDKLDAIIDQHMFDENFSAPKEVTDTEFVKLAPPVDEFHKEHRKFET